MQPMDADAVQFEALIVPHRSLSPRGLRILMASIGLLSAMLGVTMFAFAPWFYFER